MHSYSYRAKAVNNTHFHFNSIEDSNSSLGGSLILLRYSMGETWAHHATRYLACMLMEVLSEPRGVLSQALEASLKGPA